MGRTINPWRAAAVYAEIVQTPGLRAGRIAQRLETDHASIMRCLLALESLGLLVYEDHGRLYPYLQTLGAATIPLGANAHR